MSRLSEPDIQAAMKQWGYDRLTAYRHVQSRELAQANHDAEKKRKLRNV